MSDIQEVEGSNPSSPTKYMRKGLSAQVEVEQFLAKKFEGKVFVDYFVSSNGDGVSKTFHMDYYTVKNGEIFIIERDGSLYATDDTFISLSQTKELGDYSETEQYEREMYHFDADWLLETLRKNSKNENE